MKTAIEWLVQQLWNEGYFPYGVPEDMVERADKMFENQIMDAYNQGSNDYGSQCYQPEQYYNETFKSE
jgi:hypothetical protein